MQISAFQQVSSSQFRYNRKFDGVHCSLKGWGTGKNRQEMA